MESEGFEEKLWAVVEGATLLTNRSAKAGERSSLHYGGEGVLIHPAYQCVCGRHGAEDMCVTQVGLVRSFSQGLRRAGTISEERSVLVCLASRRRAE